MEKTLTFNVKKDGILNANVSHHRFEKSSRARYLRELGNVIGRENKDCKFNTFTLRVLIYPPTKRRFDPPNLSLTAKHLIDGLTDAGLWDDDDWKHLRETSFAYGGETSGDKDTFIFKFIIKEVSPDEDNS